MNKILCAAFTAAFFSLLSGAAFAQTGTDVVGGLGAQTVIGLQRNYVSPAPPADGQALVYVAAQKAWVPQTTSGTITVPVTVANGGTGATTLGANGVLIGEGTGAVHVTSAGTAGQVLTSNGAGVDPTFQAAAAGSSLTVTDGSHTVAGTTNLSVTGGTVGGTTPNATLTISGSGTPAGSNTQVQYNNSSSFGGSSGLLLSSTQVTAMIMGLGSDATGDIYYRAASTGALTRLGIGSTGNVLTVAGGLPSWAAPTTGSGTVNNCTTADAVGYYAATGTAISCLSSVGTTGQVLTSNGPGVAPSFQAAGAGTPANPTATITTSIQNGSASTYMRSDAAPAAAVASNSSKGYVQCDGQTTICPSGIISGNVVSNTFTANHAIGASDMGGQVNMNGSSLTVTFPAISSTVLAAGMTVTVVNQNASALTIATTPTINGFSGSTIAQNSGIFCVSNGVSLDCVAVGGTSGASGVASLGTSTPAIVLAGTGSGPYTGTVTANLTVPFSPCTAITNCAGNAAYTFVAADATKTINRSNTTTQTDVIPTVGTTGFGTGAGFTYCTGSTGNTLSSSSLINGNSTRFVPPLACASIASNGTTYTAALSSSFPAPLADITATGNLDTTTACFQETHYNSSSGGTITLSDNAVGVGCIFNMTQMGTAQATLAAAGSATLVASASGPCTTNKRTADQYSTIVVEVVASPSGHPTYKVSGSCG